MANYGKRMVPEYLVKGLEEAYAKTSGGTGSTINLIENIVDSKGNKRFIEVNGVLKTDNPLFSINYSKASLSGTHLMLVLDGTVSVGDSGSSRLWYEFALPEYVTSKIKKVFLNYVELKGVSAYDENGNSQTLNFGLSKEDGNIIRIAQVGTFIITNNDKIFRIQFDLLIDTE